MICAADETIPTSGVLDVGMVFQITNPPLGLMTCPVIKSAFSDARKTIAWAASSGKPIRSSGVSS